MASPFPCSLIICSDIHCFLLFQNIFSHLELSFSQINFSDPSEFKIARHSTLYRIYVVYMFWICSEYVVNVEYLDWILISCQYLIEIVSERTDPNCSALISVQYIKYTETTSHSVNRAQFLLRTRKNKKLSIKSIYSNIFICDVLS